MTYGYARVSSRDQNLDRQLNALIGFGINEKNIFCDKKSGKDFERKNYTRLLHKLKKDDLLVVKELDRLGRNYTEIIDEWSKIVNKIGADIVVLDMPLLDTRATPCSLVGKFISDIVLQVLSFVAENERQNIKQRQAEGIAAAKLKGVKFGRPKTVYSDEFYSSLEKYKNKEISAACAATLCGMNVQCFYYHYRKNK